MTVTTQLKPTRQFSLLLRFLVLGFLLLLFIAAALVFDPQRAARAAMQTTPCPLPTLQKTGSISVTGSGDVVAADFNRDGRQDVIAVLAAPAGQSQTFLGDGAGGFTPVPGGNGFTLLRNDEILVGEFNGDGFPDLYVRRDDGGNNRQVQVYMNDGQGRFTLGAEINARVLALLVGDVNNDGRDDVLANTSGNFAVYLNNANRTFTRLANEFGSGTSAVLLDMNGDGRLDFVNALIGIGRTVIFIWYGNGSGSFSQADFLALPDQVRLQKTADLNRDGRTDIVALSDCDTAVPPSQKLYLLLNNGNGNFTSNPFAIPGTSCFFSAVRGVGDFTGDGFPDIGLWDGRLAVNDGRGAICAVSDVCCTKYALNQPAISVIADFNGDNRADIINQESFVTLALWSSKATAQNTPPQIIPNFPQTFRQGYRALGQTFFLARVSDAETPVRDLKVTLGGIPGGVNIFNVQTTDGVVAAQFDVGCNALVGEYPLVITVTDGGGLSATTTWLMRISEKGPPRFTNVPSSLIVGAGAALEFPAPVAVDASDFQIDLTPANVTSPTFQGQIDALGSTGNWRIVNAAPVGTHTLTFTVTDRCGLQDVRTALLTVTGTAANTPPRVVPAAPTTIPQGSSSVEIVLATLGDAETPASNLSYDVTPLPGLQINNIRNDNGLLKGTPVIGCITPAVVYQIGIRVTDPGGLSATGTFNLTAHQNTAPEVGAYPATTSMTRNGSATISPSTPIRDNGTATATVSAPSFTGNLSVNAEGVVTINQAAPVGTHPVAVMVTDNCGLVTRREFTVVVTEPSGGGCDVLAFNTALNVESNNRPYGLTSGDFNGDGKPDLATTNLWDNTVTVLLGDANGFTKQAPIDVGVLPNYIAVKDLNNDSKLDLAVVNRGSDTVTILLGNGNGTFEKKGDYQVGNKSTGVAMGDFNGDGKLDLILPNDGLGNAAVLDGNGDGSFAPLRFVFVGSSPQPGVVADFNQDGKTDVAFPHYFSGEVTILLSNGDGTFQPPIYVGNLGGSGVEAIAVGDVNGDGKVDLAVTNTTTNQVFTILSDGRGGFTNGGGFATFSDYPASLVIADFTGDGKADIAVGGYNNNRVHIFKGLGNGFDNNAPVVIEVGAEPLSLLTNDFDGDGKPDLAVANNGLGTVSVLLNGCGK